MSNGADLTKEEQGHVRAALRFLRVRSGGWAPLAVLLRFQRESLAKVAGGRTVSASLAMRVARVGGASVDDLLAGRFPPREVCPRCGYSRPE